MLVIDSGGKSALQDKKKALGPIIMLHCIQPQGLNESDFLLLLSMVCGACNSHSL